ncbi:MAG: APC family permease [Myxococcales bacterium]|nr:MAG: APC family permease [Myxococcales bacterium]
MGISVLDRRQSLSTATLLVVASMIGTGVFTLSGILLEDLGSIASVLLVWLLGGLLAFCGALSYAELAAMFPRNGGEYALLREIYHPAIGFMAACTSFIAGFTAPVAIATLAFGHYAHRLNASLSELQYAFVLLAIITLFQLSKDVVAARFQNLLTFIKIALILAFVLVGFTQGHIGPSPLASFDSATLFSPQFSSAIITVSYAYTGWNAAIYIAGELKNPKRNIALSLALGTGGVTLVYLLLNYVFLTSAPIADLKGVIEIGHVSASALFGKEAGYWMSVVIALGLISTANAYMVTGPRVYEAVGRNYSKLAWLIRKDKHSNPMRASLLQSCAAILMILSASFEQLLVYVGTLLSVFSAITVAGVYVLRKRLPDQPRPYRCLGYPATPAFFIALMAWVVFRSISANPVSFLASILTILACFSFYLYVRKSAMPDPLATSSEDS